MKKHGNSNENESEHHLYEIRDVERDDVYKYGICGDPINSDGTTPRANSQIRDYNRAFGWMRFLARILLAGIHGRREAKRIENEYIETYRQKYGMKPPGNS